MKSKQQNNPVLLGILGIAFLFILARIFKTLTGGGNPLPSAKNEAGAQPTAGIAQTDKTKTAIESAVMRGRDPFNHPYLLQVAQEEANKQNNRNGTVGTIPTGKTPFPRGRNISQIGLPNVTPTYQSQPVLDGFAKEREQGTGNREQNTANNPITQSPNNPIAQRPNDPTKWRVTAILGGGHPTAVVESAEMSPRTVAVGDELHGFRIAAIRSDEIVVASAHTVLTLPLETHSETQNEQTDATEMSGTKALTAANLSVKFISPETICRISEDKMKPYRNRTKILLSLSAMSALGTPTLADSDTKKPGVKAAKPPSIAPGLPSKKPTVPAPIQIESIRAYLENGETIVDIQTRGVASPLLSGGGKLWTISFPGAKPSPSLAANMVSGGLVRQVGMETTPEGTTALGVKLALSASGVGSLVPSARRDLVRVRLAADLPASGAASQVKLANGLYDVNAFQSDFATILASLSKDAGSNVVVVSPPTKKITLNLKQVSFEQAVQMLASAAGMISRKENDAFYLGETKDMAAAFPKPIEEIPKPIVPEISHEVYICKYIVAADLVKSLTTIFEKDNIKVALGANTFSPRLDQTSTAAVTGVESASKGGTMSSENAQNAHNVLLYGDAELVEKALAFAKKMDIRRKQVKISVRITDINNDALRELGVQWEWSKYRASEAPNFTPSTGGAAAGSSGAAQIPQVGGINFGAFVHDAVSIQATLFALEKNDRAKLLAAPSLSLLDGERGFILIGDRLVFPVLIGFSQAGSPIFTKTEERVGIYLQVAAQIADNNEVTLTVYPQVSVVTNFLIVNGASYPQISTREQQTTVRVRDGEQIVVGGLIREEEVSNVQRVPLLSRIPFFGELFTYRKRNKRKSEVVIVITPEIQKD